MAKPSATSRATRPVRNKTPKPPIVATKDTKSSGTGDKRGRKLGSTSFKVDKNGRKLKKRRQSVATQIRLQRERRKAKTADAGGDDEKVDENGKEQPGPTKEFNDELKTEGLEWEAEKIVDSKLQKGKRFYKVKWVGYPVSQNSWEPEVNLRNSADLIAAFDEEYPEKP